VPLNGSESKQARVVGGWDGISWNLGRIDRRHETGYSEEHSSKPPTQVATICVSTSGISAGRPVTRLGPCFYPVFEPS
jgi:hypothetical protein